MPSKEAQPISRSLSIAFVTIADLPEGGGNTSRLRMLVSALVRGGHRVAVWNEHALGIAPESALQAEGELEGARFRYALGSTARSSGFGSIRQKLRAVRNISRWLKAARTEDNLDVLWFNNLTFYDTWPLTRRARKLSVATIQSYEDERQELVSGERLSFSRRVFALNSRLADRCCPPMADAIIAISSYLKDKYASLCGTAEKVHLVPTVIDCDEWQCPQEPETDCPVILYSGAFAEQDEMSEIVEALALLRGRGRDFRAVFLGANRREPLRVERVKAAVARLGLADKVDFPGFVPREEVKRHLAGANVLINIRRDGAWSRSGLSTKLSEYLASGRMVISSDVGDVNRYLRDGESALVLSPQPGAEEIATAISTGLDSRETRRRIGAAGREVARQFFDVPVAGRRLDSILKDITGGKQGQ